MTAYRQDLSATTCQLKKLQSNQQKGLAWRINAVQRYAPINVGAVRASIFLCHGNASLECAAPTLQKLSGQR